MAFTLWKHLLLSFVPGVCSLDVHARTVEGSDRMGFYVPDFFIHTQGILSPAVRAPIIRGRVLTFPSLPVCAGHSSFVCSLPTCML
jgi:hypothetical protein